MVENRQNHPCDENIGVPLRELGGNASKEIDCDEYVEQFCVDAVRVLRKYDKELSNSLKQKAVKNFYKHDWKGIGIYSATEVVIKWIIYSKLCHKYRMYPESSKFYESDKQLLDLAIYLTDDYEKVPDIAIEMKWAGFRGDKRPFSNWLKQMINDVTKLYQAKVSSNKYFMQFAFISREEWRSIGEVIENTLNDFNNSSKAHRFRNGKLSFLTKKKFLTENNEEKSVYFAILVWKIAKA